MLATNGYFQQFAGRIIGIGHEGCPVMLQYSDRFFVPITNLGPLVGFQLVVLIDRNQHPAIGGGLNSDI